MNTRKLLIDQWMPEKLRLEGSAHKFTRGAIDLKTFERCMRAYKARSQKIFGIDSSRISFPVGMINPFAF